MGVGRRETSGCSVFAAAAGFMKPGTQSNRHRTIATLTAAETLVPTV
jgi:hypothetical protein